MFRRKARPFNPPFEPGQIVAYIAIGRVEVVTQAPDGTWTIAVIPREQEVMPSNQREPIFDSPSRFLKWAPWLD